MRATNALHMFYVAGACHAGEFGQDWSPAWRAPTALLQSSLQTVQLIQQIERESRARPVQFQVAHEAQRALRSHQRIAVKPPLRLGHGRFDNAFFDHLDDQFRLYAAGMTELAQRKRYLLVEYDAVKAGS